MSVNQLLRFPVKLAKLHASTLLGRGVTFNGARMLAIFGLFAMALTAAFVIDPTPSDDEMTADGVSDLDYGQNESQSQPVHDLLEAQTSSTASENMAGSLFDLRDQVDVTAFGTNNQEEVLGGIGEDYLSGRDGDDMISGGDGHDELHGELGNDDLYGGAGDDSLFGHVGDDYLSGDGGDDTLTGGDGQDHLTGGAGADSLSGNLQNDTLIGGAGSDLLFGGAGDDLLVGNDDDEQDFLNGGAGDDRILASVADIVNTGEGADVVSVHEGAEAHVSDFNPAEDQIELEYEGDVVPVLSTQPTETGIALLADGELVMTLDGVDTFDTNQVQLIPVTA